MAAGAGTDIQRRWGLSANGDGTFDIKLNSTNPLYSDYYLYVNATNSVVLTNDTTKNSIKWAFKSITQINDAAYSTSTVVTSTTQSAIVTSTSHVSSSTSASSPSPSNPSGTTTATAPAASTTQISSGLSGGAAAGIGVGVALAVLAIAAIALWLLRRRRHRLRRLEGDTDQPNSRAENKIQAQSTELQAPQVPPVELHHNSVAELDAPRTVSELEADPVPRRGNISELGTDSTTAPGD
jgi:hypothetical protein